jgi:hypothetical protein
MKVRSPQKVDLNLNQPLPDDWCHLISQSHIMPALFHHDFGGKREERVYLVLVHLKSFISSVSAWTIEVYIDVSVPLSLCPISFSGVIGQVELT